MGNKLVTQSTPKFYLAVIKTCGKRTALISATMRTISFFLIRVSNYQRIQILKSYKVGHEIIKSIFPHRFFKEGNYKRLMATCRYCDKEAETFDDETGWSYCDECWFSYLDEYEAWNEYG